MNNVDFTTTPCLRDEDIIENFKVSRYESRKIRVETSGNCIKFSCYLRLVMQFNYFDDPPKQEEKIIREIELFSSQEESLQECLKIKTCATFIHRLYAEGFKLCKSG